MPVQGGNSIDHGFAYAGMVADAQLCNGVSKLNKGADVIPFGVGVVSDGDDGAKIPVGGETAANVVGIVKYELNRAQQDGDPHGAIPDFDMTVVTHGVVYATARVDVTKDDPVYLVVSDGTGTNQGEWSNVVGAGATLAVLVAGAKWTTSATAGNLAQISFGLGG